MDKRQPPAFRKQSSSGIWRRTPPAIFSPVLGLLGLGLAWRRASEVTGLPGAFGEALLGAVSLLYLFCLLAYLGKLVQRPGVLPADLAILPGQAGVTAANLSMMLFGSVLTPYAPKLALVLIVLSLILQAGLAAFLLISRFRGRPGAQTVTPVWHMVLVGPILAAPGLAGLDQTLLAGGIFLLTLPLALLIWGISLWQLVTRIPPAPLRPLLAIHLAPASLFATVAALLNQPAIGLGFSLLAMVILLALLIFAGWVTAAGFSPLWGAFTFPLAAVTTALLVNGWQVAGLLLLAAASAVIVPIAVLVLRAWARGTLAIQTNAAQA